MKKIKIIIVDDNEDFVYTLKEYFKHTNDFDVIGTAHNGKDGIELITPQNQPQVIILDNVMPNYDGTYFLVELQKLKIKKPVIISTSNYTDSDNGKIAKRLGVNYFMAKPCDYDILARVIKMLLEDKETQEETNTKIIEECDELIQYFSKNYKGTYLINKAIELVKEDNTLAMNINKVFNLLAEYYKMQPIRVRWNIDRTIVRTWESHKKELMRILNIKDDIRPNLKIILSYYIDLE